jgi:hypothetical protein
MDTRITFCTLYIKNYQIYYYKFIKLKLWSTPIKFDMFA